MASARGSLPVMRRLQLGSLVIPKGIETVLARLLVFLILLPVVEIAVLAWIASKTSLLLVIALVLGMGVLGSLLARHQGLRMLQRVSLDLSAGRMPGDSLLDALLVLLAGLLLILPGVLSDMLAIALLIPSSRRMLKGLVRRYLSAQVNSIHVVTTGNGFDGDDVIDVPFAESPQGRRSP
jgi:UPF0716 protein FxsA